MAERLVPRFGILKEYEPQNPHFLALPRVAECDTLRTEVKLTGYIKYMSFTVPGHVARISMLPFCSPTRSLQARCVRFPWSLHSHARRNEALCA